jgi:hypothetical protein
MATGQNQFGGYAVSGGDIPCANYGATDIEAGLIVLLDTSNQVSTTQPPGVVLPTASGGVAGTFGITVDKLYAITSTGVPKPGRVRVIGSYPVIANGSITAGGYVQASDTVSKLGYAKACGAGTEQIGQAINSVSDGEICHVLICKAKNA